MRPYVLLKQASETFRFGVSFEDWLGEGETIDAGSSQVVAEKDGQDVTSEFLTSPSVQGPVLSVRLLPGFQAGDRIKVSFRAATSEGNLYEEDVFVMIFD